MAENLYHPDESDNDSAEDDDCTPFEYMAKKMEDICPVKDRGILKKILKQGSGDVVPIDSVVRVHYSGFQEYADEPFDSTRLQNNVKKFRVGQGEVIEGFDVAVSTMRKGELSRFLIAPEYGFMDCGAPPRIPAKATVLFEIELLSFVEHAGLDDYFIMTQVLHILITNAVSYLFCYKKEVFHPEQSQKLRFVLQDGFRIFEIALSEKNLSYSQISRY